MWVFIRPRGGQDCYLLTCESRGCLEFCPIHRFDGLDQILGHRSRPRLSGGKYGSGIARVSHALNVHLCFRSAVLQLANDS
jgi:hypothetical protein